ncbi:DNA mismatch repair endonuclease MutL [uncultured Prevotella sp.]|uniref:DNA mismatch repair endonuclease MutL n=1 Tax=uncultured Prevotella sp. TaxID=159272 RepID=UPI0028058243|nr:DNA mismatch repair endonuclease MutL [uncultured Prevotella sp.]
MSDIIQLLPDSVANQIAAGEVIQRPASVIKELVENSVDAGATIIKVLVVDAGRTSIQVVDNGKGMSEIDARLSFERHATSKIRKADDLFSLHTMGFRGEALASIAAVAQVELKTRIEGDELGCHLSISGGSFVGQEPCQCAVGSNFLIENLFFNVPARRKFLKSNTTELNNIITAFQRIALVYPSITFTLHSNDTEMFNLHACSFKQRIVEIFGKRLSHELLPVEVETTLCNIHGFVGKPESSKKKGAHQYLFVNDRYMKHPYFHKAIMSAYERLIPQGEQVSYFIYFNVPAEDIDVNIHPTKTEIKFENEQAIWQILMAAVRDAIGKFHDVSAIDFDTEGRPDIPVFDPENEASAPKMDFNPNFNPFKESSFLEGGSQSSNTTFAATQGKTSSKSYTSRADFSKVSSDNWEELYAGSLLANDKNEEGEACLLPSLGFKHEDEGVLIASKMSDEAAAIIEEKSPSHYQYKGRYIMTAVKSGLMIIDQHRAHVRILYEQYLKQFAEHKGHTQKMLFPEVVHLTATELTVLEKISIEMQEIGFQLDDLGGGSFAINGVPAGLEGLNIINLVQEMISTAHEKGVSVKEDINKSLATSLAHNAAIPAGQVLSNQEMEALVNDLFACENVNYTPSGKVIIAVLKQQDIESRF